MYITLFLFVFFRNLYVPAVTYEKNLFTNGNWAVRSVNFGPYNMMVTYQASNDTDIQKLAYSNPRNVHIYLRYTFIYQASNDIDFIFNHISQRLFRIWSEVHNLVWWEQGGMMILFHIYLKQWIAPLVLYMYLSKENVTCKVSSCDRFREQSWIMEHKLFMKELKATTTSVTMENTAIYFVYILFFLDCSCFLLGM